MNRIRIFAFIVACMTAALCISCNDSSNMSINTSNPATETINSDSSDGTVSNNDTQSDEGDDTNTESGSDATSQRLLSSHISGGGSAQSSNYAANISVGGPAAGRASSTNYDITIGTGAIVYGK